MKGGFLLCEYYGETPRGRDMHIRVPAMTEHLDAYGQPRPWLTTCYASLGGAVNTALCGFNGKLHDHPTPDINKRDLSGICPWCLELFKKTKKATKA